MSFRFMRILLFFDLPRGTVQENKDANLFRKNLIKEGFLMLQESVYCKLALNDTAIIGIKLRINKIKPPSGNIMLLSITENQFSKMDILYPTSVNVTVDTTERLIII